MRPLALPIAFAALLAAGCGDDNPGEADLAVKTDLASSPADMSLSPLCAAGSVCGCNSLQACIAACQPAQDPRCNSTACQTCTNNCIKFSTQKANRLDFELRFACIMRYCNAHSDGGMVCLGEADGTRDFDPTAEFTPSCQACYDDVSARLFPPEPPPTLDFNAVCGAERAACMADTP